MQRTRTTFRSGTREPGSRRVPNAGIAATIALLFAVPGLAQEFAELLEIRRVKETLDLSQVPEPDLTQVPAVDAQRLRDYRALTENALDHAAEPMQAQLAANTYGDLCARYLHYELHEATAVCLEQLRELAPADFQWTYFKLLLNIALGDLEAARTSAEEALAIRPDDPPTLIRLAELHVAAGDVDAAETAYEAAIAAYPESATARIGLGYIALERGDPTQALQIFQEVAASQPEGSEANHHGRSRLPRPRRRRPGRRGVASESGHSDPDVRPPTRKTEAARGGRDAAARPRGRRRRGGATTNGRSRSTRRSSRRTRRTTRRTSAWPARCWLSAKTSAASTTCAERLSSTRNTREPPLRSRDVPRSRGPPHRRRPAP